MEPVEEQVTRHTMITEVVRVFERKERSYIRGFGENAVFSEQSLGWHVVFDGWRWGAIQFGKDKPDLCPGDRVIITFEKERAYDKPKQASV